jgi:hypothetical protein
MDILTVLGRRGRCSRCGEDKEGSLAPLTLLSLHLKIVIPVPHPRHLWKRIREQW